VATRRTGAEPARGEVGTGPVLGDRAYDALLRPVRAGNAFEETLERLLTAIKLGIVAPGARLPPERDLAERLSVSRVTLREAIRALQQSGYVESRRGRYGGTVVKGVLPKLNKIAARRLAKQTGAELEDVLTLREVLEIGAAERAAVNRHDDVDAKHLTACLHDCENATDPAEYRRPASTLRSPRWPALLRLPQRWLNRVCG
jgi:DNA-binding FadR family transcriptional regulator